MTVPTDQVKQFYNGNGTTIVFYFYFRLILATDLQVYVNNSLISGSNYTVAINSNGIGGTVTFNTAPAAGVNNVLLYRFVDYLQETHFPNESDFNQVSLEDSIDKLTMECQQLQEEVSRCIIAPVTGGPDITYELPDPAANNAIGWDPTGTFLVDLPLSDGILGPTGATGATGPTGPSGSALDMVVLEDQRASNTTAGGITAGAWTRLNLNTKVLDTATICSLAANQFTLPAGTYRLRASSSGNNSNGHQIRLRNVTNGTTTLLGTQAWSNNTNAIAGYAATPSLIDGQFTITGTKTFELQVIVAHTTANNLNPGSQINTGELSVFSRIVIERGGTGPIGPAGATGATGPAGGGTMLAFASINGADGSLNEHTSNVSCVRNSAGDYTLTFSPALPSNKYSVQFTEENNVEGPDNHIRKASIPSLSGDRQAGLLNFKVLISPGTGTVDCNLLVAILSSGL